MGNYTSTGTDEDLIAAALSAAFDRRVVTREEYERRQTEPEFSLVETLDLQKFSSAVYEPATGRYGSVYGKSGKQISVTLVTLTGRNISLTVGSESYVEELKFALEEQEGFPIDHSRLVLVFNKKCLQDGHRISEYGIGNSSYIDFTVSLQASGPTPVLILDKSLRVSEHDFDFSTITDDGKVYKRGGQHYFRPYGWKRYALNVKERYEDDRWLGEAGIRQDSTPGEWPVSYHGTAHENVKSIAMDGYDLSKAKRMRFGKGVYSTPSIAVAERYAKSFTKNRKNYKVVFQNRVNSEGMEIIPAEEANDSAEYWVQPISDFVRPYGVCIRRCN